MAINCSIFLSLPSLLAHVTLFMIVLGSCLCISCCISLFIDGFLVPRRTRFSVSSVLFGTLTLCPAPKLPVTREMAEQNRQQSCLFQVCLWGMLKTVSLWLSYISGWLDIFQMVRITQGPHLSSSNDSFTITFSFGYSS